MIDGIWTGLPLTFMLVKEALAKRKKDIMLLVIWMSLALIDSPKS
jgi:hypothetical protein